MKLPNLTTGVSCFKNPQPNWGFSKDKEKPPATPGVLIFRKTNVYLITRTVLRNKIFISANFQFHAAVLCAAFGGSVIGNRV
jgi:hypothetical protein